MKFRNFLNEEVVKLSQEVINQIEDKINNELVKRGFKEVTIEQTGDMLSFVGDNSFQTTPKLFRDIQVTSRNGGMRKDQDKIMAWVPVCISYTLLSRGTNGFTLFDFVCSIVDDTIDEFRIRLP